MVEVPPVAYRNRCGFGQRTSPMALETSGTMLATQPCSGMIEPSATVWASLSTSKPW